MSTSVIRVGVAYVNVRVSRRLKEELKLSWAIDKRLWLIIITMSFKTVILKNKAVFNLNNIVCIAVCNIFQLMHINRRLHY